MKSTWVHEFKKYLENTDKAKLKEEWAEIEEMQFKGPNAYEYMGYVCEYYSAKRVTCRPEELGFPKNRTPR